MTASAISQIINMSKETIIAFIVALISAVGIILLGSCASDDEITQSNYPSDNIVRVDVGVNNMTTRASMETGTLEEFSFTILNENPTNGNLYSYNNINVTKSESSWMPEEQMLWQNSTQPVTVIAYAPYKSALKNVANKTDYEVSVAQEQKADTYESDFLVCKMKDFIPGTGVNNNGAVPIAFNHALSQLEIKVVFGTELDNPDPLTKSPITSITVNNVYLSGTCDFTQETPKVTATNSEEPNTVTPYEVPNSFVAAKNTAAGEVSNATATYSCILIPQTLSGPLFGVTLTMNDGKTYKWTASMGTNNTLEGGNKYTLTLTVGKDYVVAGDMSATPWDEADSSSYKQNIETD